MKFKVICCVCKNEECTIFVDNDYSVTITCNFCGNEATIE